MRDETRYAGLRAEAPAPPGIAFTPRVRKSPFFEATRRWGCAAYSVYNHMYVPTRYRGAEADYWNLVLDVTVWDVACERQVQVHGPDAARFVQHLTCRDLSDLGPGRARYAFLVDECGGIVNDPVVLRLAADRFWISVADSDVLLWAKGLAAGGHWAVAIDEPDVSPLQVQGPKSPQLMRDLFGPRIGSLDRFGFFEAELGGIPLVVSRTGYSGERGYEVFLRDGRHGDELWERLMTAGEPYRVRPGAPSAIRRVEAGLLSYRNDMGLEHTPFDLGFPGMVCLDDHVDYLGKGALARAAQRSPRRRLVGVVIDGTPLPENEHPWPLLVDSAPVGAITSAAHSPRLGRNIAFAMVEAPRAAEGTRFTAACDGAERIATAVPLPFIGVARRFAGTRSSDRAPPSRRDGS